jgi:PAS domain S-box-containing protein
MNGPITDTVVAEKLFKFLTSHSPEIYADWLAALEKRRGPESASQGQAIMEKRKAKADLFSLLMQFLATGKSGDQGVIAESASQSLDDLLVESSLLAKSAQDVLNRTEGLADREERHHVSHVLQETLSQVMREIMGVKLQTYEQIVEHGQRGFCLMDMKGRILHANARMKKLAGPGELEGKRLDHFFCKDDRGKIIKAFEGHEFLQRLPFTDQKGDLRHVGIEIGSLNYQDQPRGAYACLVDLTESEEGTHKIYSQFPQGIIQWKIPFPPDPPENAPIIYANAKAAEIAGYESLIGKTLKELFPDTKNQAIIKKQIAKRQIGIGDDYEVKMTSAKGEKIPLRVSSIPEVDLHGQKVVRNVTIIRNLIREGAIADINDIIATCRTSDEIFQAITHVLKKLIPFEHCEVMVYTPDHQYARRLFPGPDVKPNWEMRWYKLSPEIIKWVKGNKKVESLPFKELVQKFSPDILKKEEYIPYAQYNSLLRYPVIREKKTVATINFFHKKKNIYLQNHEELLEALPLGKAALLSLYYEEKANLEFKLNLIKELTLVSHDIPSVYRTILEKLAAHYKWQSVALFKVDKEDGEINLLDQEPSDLSWKLDDNFSEKLSGKGILAYVARQKKPKLVNIDDVDEHPIAKKHYFKGLEKTKSELCIPLEAGYNFLLLNIEDSRIEAFSPEEVRSLTEEILPEVKNFLEGLSRNHIADIIQRSTSDMIIVTDNSSRIKEINQATTANLGFTRDEIIDAPFQKLFADVEIFAKLKPKATIDNEDVTFKNKSGNDIKVLLSGANFPPGINGRFYVAKDITLYERGKELQCLTDVVGAMSTQARTALSLASSWLDNLAGSESDVVEKIRRQLHKVELTLDRFALYDIGKEIPPNKLLLRISEILGHVEAQFPLKEFKKIHIAPYPPKLAIQADPFQLVFCLTSILSYLVRYVPENKKIDLNIVPGGNDVLFKISGFWPEAKLEKSLYRTMFELELGEQAIRHFMANHNGEFNYKPLEGNRINFNLRIAQ